MTSRPLVVLAHGSRDRRSTDTAHALVERIRARRPGLDVHAAFLDLAEPSLDAVVDRLVADGHRDLVVVPLLLSDAYHATVDVPAAVRAAGAGHPATTVELAPPIGPDPALLDVVDRRLGADAELDGLVLVAAGSSDAAANLAVAGLAGAWGARRGLPALAAFVTSATPTVGEAVRRLRGRGAGRVGVGLLLLAPGVLPDRATSEAANAGATAVGDPLGTEDVVARLVLDRYAAARDSVPS